MENLINSTSLSQISFPVFQLNTNNPVVENGVIMYIRSTLTEDDIIKHEYQIVDDKTVEGDTLAKRRLKLYIAGVNLKPIKRAIYFIGDLIKLATPKMYFIDSKGLLFKYSKTRTVRLVFRKITKVIAIPDGGAILEIQGFPNRFKCLYAPRREERYAGVLVDKISAILYGIYTEKYDDTVRKI